MSIFTSALIGDVYHSTPVDDDVTPLAKLGVLVSLSKNVHALFSDIRLFYVLEGFRSNYGHVYVV